jgi:cytochrome o ubiquinol oxidase subunit 3
MTAQAQDPYRIGRDGGGDQNTGRGEGGPASKRTTVGYGFWIYLLSDIILFSGFFAAYAVLAKQTAGGPSPHELFGQERVALETVALLLSSFTCGLAGVAAEKRKLVSAQLWLLATGLLGAVFLGLEVTEFAEMIGEGAGPQRSAFLSAFCSGSAR